VAAAGRHRELLLGHPGYRAVVTRETDEEQSGRATEHLGGQGGPAPLDMTQSLESSEESA
jgi:hypothetical protein